MGDGLGGGAGEEEVVGGTGRWWTMPLRYKISFCLCCLHQSKFSSAKLLAGDVICVKVQQSSFLLPLLLSSPFLKQVKLFQPDQLYLRLPILLIIPVSLRDWKWKITTINNEIYWTDRQWVSEFVLHCFICFCCNYGFHVNNIETMCGCVYSWCCVQYKEQAKSCRMPWVCLSVCFTFSLIHLVRMTQKHRWNNGLFQWFRVTEISLLLLNFPYLLLEAEQGDFASQNNRDSWDCCL